MGAVTPRARPVLCLSAGVVRVLDGSALVSAAWLQERLGNPGLVVADCRFTLGQPDAGREKYDAGHVPGAVYLDLERDLSAPVRATGGRHPLPEPATLARTLAAAGVGNESAVVAYDDSGGAYAARLWWLLRWLGHDAVAVLDGGFAAWTGAGGPVTTEEPHRAPARLTPHPRPEMLASAADVRDRPAGSVLIDSRAPARYRGETEPIDPVAGHIPGAINRDWAAGVGPEGRFRPPAEQAERLAVVEKPDEAIVYCGSGVTAAANLLALELAGKPGARLSAGSWSDWISDPTNPVATGDGAG